jgi:hypothetical protein
LKRVFLGGIFHIPIVVLLAKVFFDEIALLHQSQLDGDVLKHMRPLFERNNQHPQYVDADEESPKHPHESLELPERHSQETPSIDLQQLYIEYNI